MKPTHPVLDVLLNRKSVRAYEGEISQEVKDAIIAATLRAPTAGNMMLYSVIEIADQSVKERLVETCDNQPFIAKAPWVLLFLADYQRWYDYFITAGVEALCEERGAPMRTPQEGDLFLACCDALIAAQTAVIAAESLGVGSCYIGDIMENYEVHREMFRLPRYVFPIAMVCFGHPTEQQRAREMTTRFDRKFIVFEGQYRHLHAEEFEEMYREQQERLFEGREALKGARNVGQFMYLRKFGADFTLEMTRSVRAILKAWVTG
ncbi:MAG: nitroreductase family protein [Anaerolineae bacterium]|nr:nitroreductase family protein [Anaerolineae bacterium]